MTELLERVNIYTVIRIKLDISKLINHIARWVDMGLAVSFSGIRILASNLSESQHE